MPPKVHRANGSVPGKPAGLCILAFSLGFTAYLSNAVVSALFFQRRVVLKPLVSLIGRLVARISVGISVGGREQTGSQSRGPCKRAHARLRIVMFAVNCVIQDVKQREHAFLTTSEKISIVSMPNRRSRSVRAGGSRRRTGKS